MMFYDVFSDKIFYPHVLQKFQVLKADDLAQLLPCLDL